jgi:hypothetical protein
MLTKLRKVVGLQYKFSTLESFRASEKILKTAYLHDEHINENFEK